MSLPISIVDAFTAEPFRGNPAAVCLLDSPRDDAWLQRVAAEMNLSETAFLLREGQAWRLRWCTPKSEVDLCGHATLASAHWLWERGFADADAPITFETRSGRLTATRRDGMIFLDFPAVPATPCETPAGLLEALRIEPTAVCRNRFDYLVELRDPNQLRDLEPNFDLLGKIEMRGLIVTSPADESGVDFLSRFFAPGQGINEDPVTGSAHCCLAVHWNALLGKTEMIGYQASPRGGYVHVRLDHDRVELGGTAVTITAGELQV